jgi:hypothetical protein
MTEFVDMMYLFTMTFLIFGGVYIVLVFVNLFLGAVTKEIEEKTEEINKQE